MKSTILLFGLLLGIALAAAEPSTVFEVRLVIGSASADSEEMIWTHQGNVPGRSVDEKLHVQKKPLLNGPVIRSATARKEPVTGGSEIVITLTTEGAKRFADITRDRVGQRFAFLIDGKVYSAPKIATEIRGGRAVITGFTQEQAAQLAKRLNEGATK
ncbi:MAG: SecDF P1 head subdomain-containing protein [Limisphaerales bacterium]